MKRRKSVMIIVFLILIIIVNFIFPWTIITNYHEYSLKESFSSTDSWISVWFRYAKTQEHLIVPFLYKKVINDSPYHYVVWIFGDFDSVYDIEWYFLINNKEKIFIDIWEEVINKLGNKEKIFSYNSEKPLVLDWWEMKDMKLVIDFIWEQDGNQIKIRRKTSIEKKYFHDIWITFFKSFITEYK